MRRLLPPIAAVLLALPTGLIAASVDRVYEATASGRIESVVPPAEIDRLRAAGGLPRLGAHPLTPFLPGGRPRLEAVTGRAVRQLDLEPPPESGDVRVIDTESELVFQKYKDPVRQLKVKARHGDPQTAARLANAVFASYLLEREQVLIGGLRQAGARLAEGSTPALRRASTPLRLEAAEAADIAIRLGGGLLVGKTRPARPPQESILPHPARDAVVAGLIGLLLGVLVVRRRPRIQAMTSPAARAS